MSRFRPFFSLAYLAAATLASASPAENPSALSTLRAFGRERGDKELSRVVGVVGFHGREQPPQWLMLQTDARVPNLLHEYAMEGGRIVAHRQFFRDPGQDMPTIPIELGKLSIDSRQAFILADQAARRAGIGFDSMNYQLRCRDLRNEPVWVLSLMDDANRVAGVIYLSAITGETLRTVWQQPGATTMTGPVVPRQGAEKPVRGLIPQLVDRISDRREQSRPMTPPNAYAAPHLHSQGTR